MIHARIQGHPSRHHLHGLLAESLGMPSELMLHESEPPSPWAGYRNCLSHIPPCDHLLIVQDDVTVCHNFAPALHQIAASNPETVVVLFLARLPGRVAKQALQTAKRRQCYLDVQLRGNEFMPCVGVLWPRQKAIGFLEWSTANPRRLGHAQPRSDDGVAGRWAAFTKEVVRFTVPSLVQHPDIEPSLIGRQPAWGRDSGRVAQMMAEDGLQYDWS